jgi:8-oxo-dGTP pyrophosphatase MutT (NUDIX family)
MFANADPIARVDHTGKSFIQQSRIPVSFAMLKRAKVLSAKLDHEYDWMRIYKSKIALRDGKTVYWYTPRMADFVVVVPIKGRDVYLVKEWRIAWNAHLVIPPAGTLGWGTTERQRRTQARNELREEIGFDAKSIKKLGQFRFSSRIHATCHVYQATGLFKHPKARDEGEYIEVVKIPLTSAYEKFLSGELPTTSYGIAALTLAKEKANIAWHRQNGQSRNPTRRPSPNL